MPKGPRGEKRPADVIGAAIMVGRIATGEATEERASKKRGRAGGLKGGESRARRLTPEQREEIARLAAKTRWKKS
jgi:hypothetical protein